MTHHVPQRQTALLFAEHEFERYLPNDSTGYVRPFREAESAQEYYVHNGFGFFSPDGTLLGGATDRDDIFKRAKDEGFTPYHVH